MLKTLKRIVSKFHKKIILIFFYGQQITFSKTGEVKTIIICFDGIFSHGGFVDRIKGIISFYEVAKQLNCNFKIRFDHPFDLSIYFKPNTYNWQIENNKVKFNPFDTQIVYLMDNFSANPKELIKQSKAKTILVYSNIDYLKAIHPALSPKQIEEKWQVNFNELFKKTSFLEQELSLLPQENHIVFHTRFTSLMGDFKDSTVKIISEEEKEQIQQALVKKINSKINQFPNTAVYILSDSILFLEFIKRNTKYKVLEGTPKHIGIKDSSASIESHTKTLTDFFFIASADSVYLLKEPKMYNSSFSKYAAILGNKPFEIIQ